MAFCGACGTNVSEGLAFCTNCGSAVGQPVNAVSAPPKAVPVEQTIFNEGNIFISNSRFVSGSQTYAMSGITSVGTAIDHPSKFGPVITILAGGFIALLGLVNIAKGGLGPFFFGAVIAGLGVMVFVKRVPVYTVLLHSASGEQRATTSKDQSLIQQIVGAVNDAIVMRG